MVFWNHDIVAGGGGCVVASEVGCAMGGVSMAVGVGKQCAGGQQAHGGSEGIDGVENKGVNGSFRSPMKRLGKKANTRTRRKPSVFSGLAVGSGIFLQATSLGGGVSLTQRSVGGVPERPPKRTFICTSSSTGNDMSIFAQAMRPRFAMKGTCLIGLPFLFAQPSGRQM